MPSALGPFQVIFGGDHNALKAFILTASSEAASSSGNERKESSDEGVSAPYVVLLRNSIIDDKDVIVEAAIFQLVDIDKPKSAVSRKTALYLYEDTNSRLFNLVRLSRIQFMLELVSKSTASNKYKSKTITLMDINLDTEQLKTMLKSVKISGGSQIVFHSQLKMLHTLNSSPIFFGSKMDGDIFMRSLEHHSDLLSEIHEKSSDDANIRDQSKLQAKGKQRIRKQSSNVLVSLRRTSENSDPLAFEVIGMSAPPFPVKKRKCSKTNPAPSILAEPPSKFYFIIQDDFPLLTDYYILLYSQIKRGVMTEADLNNGNRKYASSVDIGPGCLGLRCRHCGGKDKGSYFPSSCKNLQATPPTLHTHLLKCQCCPEIVKRSLKLCKTKHKTDMQQMRPGDQTIFYTKIWKRIQDPSFEGEANSQAILERLSLIFKQYTSAPNNGIELKTTRDNIDDMIPTIVSYDELENDTVISQALSAAQSDEVTEEDMEIAYELLLRPPTPDSHIDLTHSPLETITTTPIPYEHILPSITTRVSDNGELYMPHNGEFFISEQYRFPLRKVTTETTVDSASKQLMTDLDDIAITRKFTRDDEMNLIRGILVHGKKWKVIWSTEPQLRHIYPSALKDRSRSRRFKEIFAKVEADPSLLKDPEALCGSENQPEYMDYTPTRENGYNGMYSNMSNLSEDEVRMQQKESLPLHLPPNYIPGIPIEARVDRSPLSGKKKTDKLV